MTPRGSVSPDGAGPEDTAYIFFKDKPVFGLHDKAQNLSIRARSLPLTKVLNKLWRKSEPMHLDVVSSGNGALIEHEGTVVMEVLPGDAGGGDVNAVAAQWARSLEAILREHSESAGLITGGILYRWFHNQENRP